MKDLSFYENNQEQLFESLNEFLEIQENPILTKKQIDINNFLVKEHKKHFNKNPNELFTEYDSLKLLRLVKNTEGCLTNKNLSNLNFD